MLGLVKRGGLLAVAAGVAIAGCGSNDNSSSSGDQGSKPSPVAIAASKSLAALKVKVLSNGPNGEAPQPASDVKLTADEVAKVKKMNASAAIVMHYAGNDWSTAQIAGLKNEFGQLGIKVIAVTDANFKPDKQVSDIETVLARRPNIIVSIPTDPVATAGAYRKADAQGVKLVFMDNVPKGFQPGKDYVSAVSADNYGNGVASAHLMAEKLNGKGKIGVIFHAADFFVTQQRYDAFTATLARDYPNLKVVAKKGIAGPDFAGDAEKAASAMLTQHPDLDGIWAVWDVPAEGVLAAARAAGRKDLVITTCDLGQNVAIDIAKGGPVFGLGAQRPFDQGTTEAKLAAYGLLDKKAPPYVALNALPVKRDNLASAWNAVYHAPLPSKIKQAEQ